MHSDKEKVSLACHPWQTHVRYCHILQSSHSINQSKSLNQSAFTEMKNHVSHRHIKCNRAAFGVKICLLTFLYKAYYVASEMPFSHPGLLVLCTLQKTHSSAVRRWVSPLPCTSYKIKGVYSFNFWYVYLYESSTRYLRGLFLPKD